MKRSLLPIWFVLCVVFCSCKDNVVCPAFQSTYILDDSIRWARYSLFENDSTPKFTASSRRTKYGVNKKIHFFKKNYELMTAPKVNVLAPPKEDSLFSEDEGDFLVSDFVDADTLAVDSLGIDSVAIAPSFAKSDEPSSQEPRYKYRYRTDDAFNQEQVYYNKYYGELFKDTRPLPPTPEELEELRQAEEAEMELDSLGDGGKKGLFGGFGKKKRNKSDEDFEEESAVDPETLEEAQEIIEESDAPETEADEGE